jgi:hypothetical protein
MTRRACGTGGHRTIECHHLTVSPHPKRAPSRRRGIGLSEWWEVVYLRGIGDDIRPTLTRHLSSKDALWNPALWSAIYFERGRQTFNNAHGWLSPSMKWQEWHSRRHVCFYMPVPSLSLYLLRINNPCRHFTICKASLCIYSWWCFCYCLLHQYAIPRPTSDLALDSAVRRARSE